MAEDAITDEVCDLNPFKGIRIRASDPRAQKKRRPIRVFSFEEMHRFAKAAGRYEALVRTFTDTGMRLGEVLPLRAEDFDGETLQVRRTAHEGDDPRGHQDRPRRGGRRPRRPGPGDPRLDARSPDQPERPRLRADLHDAERADVAGAELLPRRLEADPGSLRPGHPPPRVPPQLRHASPAAGVNDADLAEIAGHRVETMLARYTHALGKASRACGRRSASRLRNSTAPTRYSRLCVDRCNQDAASSPWNRSRNFVRGRNGDECSRRFGEPRGRMSARAKGDSSKSWKPQTPRLG